MEYRNSVSLKQWLSSYIEISEINGGFIMNITTLETVILLWLESKKQTVKRSTIGKYKDSAERFHLRANTIGRAYHFVIFCPNWRDKHG